MPRLTDTQGWTVSQLADVVWLRTVGRCFMYVCIYEELDVDI